ncbi:MAG TPA: choice-of-anchor Q domain-containing protein, partial [Verrucomicrobiae bacterium]|nr:choice-of-anchor Q domain-containing protein [Verrucomicrobiae bacterium]
GSVGLLDGAKSDQVGSEVSPIDPLIGPLRINGGTMPTHALLPGSPAIDQGNSFGVETDERGDSRPYDFNFVPDAPGADGSDIGAFELDPNQP